MSSEFLAISTAATSLVTTAETAVLTFTIPPENQSPGTGLGLYFNGTANLTPGTGTTSITCRIRQGTGTGGAVVGVPCTTPVTAALANSTGEITVNDPQDVYPAGNTYTMTVQQNAATGNGTMSQALVAVTPVTAGNG
jgi:hypothetical protein